LKQHERTPGLAPSKVAKYQTQWQQNVDHLSSMISLVASGNPGIEIPYVARPNALHLPGADDLRMAGIVHRASRLLFTMKKSL
jgi:hypothetical protein